MRSLCACVRTLEVTYSSSAHAFLLLLICIGADVGSVVLDLRRVSIGDFERVFGGHLHPGDAAARFASPPPPAFTSSPSPTVAIPISGSCALLRVLETCVCLLPVESQVLQFVECAVFDAPLPFGEEVTSFPHRSSFGGEYPHRRQLPTAPGESHPLSRTARTLSTCCHLGKAQAASGRQCIALLVVPDPASNARYPSNP